MGSLVCALASYLDARQNGGSWLVRVEDIDPPREQPGATRVILRCLEAHGLTWDGEVMYQSRRSEAYLAALDKLTSAELCYRCVCTRKRLSALDSIYDGHCRRQRHGASAPASIRLNIDAARHYLGATKPIDIVDRVQDTTTDNLAEDFIIHRKDGLFAYQLAVVVDDIDQGVTHIVRGHDLFDSTGKQLFLGRILRGGAIDYAHIPVLTDTQGLKLSKQNRASAVDHRTAGANLVAALTHLKQSPPSLLTASSVTEIITWGIENWDIAKLKGETRVLV